MDGDAFVNVELMKVRVGGENAVIYTGVALMDVATLLVLSLKA